MKIIALGHKKDVGKDTFAKFMMTYLRCECPELKIKRISFAEKLKDVCYQLYSWAGLQRAIYYESHRDEKEKVLPQLWKSPRQIYIEVGNKLREVYDDTWIDFVLKDIVADIIIITDLRFKNEANAVKSLNGQLIRIDRPDRELGTDPAEVDLDSWTDWDLIISNYGTLKDLNIQAEEFARSLL